MTNFQAWIPPAGAVVDPPVHPKTIVEALYSDGEMADAVPAACHNWSAEGDGPRVVAYAIVEEYKPAPKVAREFWIVDRCEAYDNERDALDAADELRYKCSVIHVREVPQGREVVAWAVVRDDFATCFYEKKWADNFVEQRGGTVVKLTGVLP